MDSDIPPNSRIRYYKREIPATVPGRIRGAARVLERNNRTGQTLEWRECYDHDGNVVRIRILKLNGNEVLWGRLPTTEKELEIFLAELYSESDK